MSDYQKVKCLKLNLKGAEKRKKKDKKHKKHKKAKLSEEEKKAQEEFEKDVTSHGGWWPISKIEEIKGIIAIEMGKRVYVSAMDNGKFTLGAPRDKGDAPDLTEQLTGVVISDTKIALKTGFGKYLSINKDSVVVGISDAIGVKEQWEPIFQDGKLALMATNNCFISCNEEGDIVATDRSATKENFIKIRSISERITKSEKDELPVEERDAADMKECEVNYVKKFQSWQDGKLRLSKKDVDELDKAKNEGKLHDALLNRRAKMKSDRYCM